MRQPNYQVGWYIPNQIAALTHFHADVTAEDFMAVIQAAQELLQHVGNEFHIIIDNRVVAMSAPATLAQMKQMAPFMNHPLLRWVVVIKPEQLVLDTDSLPIERDGATQLKNVSSLKEALEHLGRATNAVQWHRADETFFQRKE
jgi:hypothetical protein